MKTISSLSKPHPAFKDTVVAIGVFDGMHRGHQFLVKKAQSFALSRSKESVCVTFHPHPQKQPYLISLKHRLRLIEGLGIDYCLVIPFTRRLARIRAEDFVKDVLVKSFQPSAIFIGDDFRFGYKAKGDVELLKTLGRKLGFKVYALRKLRAAGRIISSRRIRGLVRSGNLKDAEIFLGRRVSVLGTVIAGAKRGRVLGYPTANINPHHEVLPKEGVYAVKVRYKDKAYNGLCNIGRRPTFNSEDDDRTIEVHLFDFHKDIYAEDVEIDFIRKIREERRFPSASALSVQIKKDSQKALSILEKS